QPTIGSFSVCPLATADRAVLKMVAWRVGPSAAGTDTPSTQAVSSARPVPRRAVGPQDKVVTRASRIPGSLVVQTIRHEPKNRPRRLLKSSTRARGGLSRRQELRENMSCDADWHLIR